MTSDELKITLTIKDDIGDWTIERNGYKMDKEDIKKLSYNDIRSLASCTELLSRHLIFEFNRRP